MGRHKATEVVEGLVPEVKAKRKYTKRKPVTAAAVVTPKPEIWQKPPISVTVGACKIRVVDGQLNITLI